MRFHLTTVLEEFQLVLFAACYMTSLISSTYSWTVTRNLFPGKSQTHHIKYKCNPILLKSSYKVDGMQEALSVDENVKELLSLASKYKREKKLSQAVQTYDDALVALPGDLEVTFQRALCLSQMGYINEAIKGFTEANTIRLRRNNITTHFASKNSKPSREAIYLANVMLDGRGEKEAALEIYRDCGVDSPMITLTGVALASLGQTDEAMKCFQQALLLDGGDADYETMIHLCISMLRLEEYQQHQTSENNAYIDELMAKVDSSQYSHMASSWKYIHDHSKVWQAPTVHYFTYDMIQLAVNNTELNDGLILECGVYHGKTIRMIANSFPNDIIHGFDTFEGLPTNWFKVEKGAYSTHGILPSVPSNVRLHKGLFADTIPTFLEDHTSTSLSSNQHIRLINIDCDMYSSTKDIFDSIYDRICAGTVIVFDEYVGNPNWKEDEYKAFQEALKEYGWKYEYLGISMVSQQAVIKITEIQ